MMVYSVVLLVVVRGVMVLMVVALLVVVSVLVPVVAVLMLVVGVFVLVAGVRDGDICVVCGGSVHYSGDSGGL